MTVTRAGIYVRISEDDGSALGVDRQLADCKALASRLGWDVVDVFSDNDVSATRSRVRPEYQRMLKQIHAGQIGAVVVWDVDRLTRTPRELEDVIDLADAKHLRLASVGGDVDLGTEQGRMTARMKGSVARYEVEQNRRRLKRKFDELAVGGHPTGKPAFGYTRSRVERDGRLVAVDTINPAEAEIVRESARRVLAGEGLWAIVKDLNARGVTTNTGGPWQTQTLRRMLLRPRNAALRVHRGVVVGKAAWDPILDEETFHRLTATLTDPSRRTSNRGTAVKYLLSNLAICGECGGRLVGTAEFVYSYRTFPHRYVCMHAGCHKVSRAMAPVDDVVEQIITGVLERDGVNLLGGDERTAGEARERIAALQAKLAVVADQFASDLITAEQLERITGRLRPELEAEKRRLAAAQPRDEFAAFAGPGSGAAWAAADVETKRAVLNKIATVTIHKQGPGRAFDPELVVIEWKGAKA